MRRELEAERIAIDRAAQDLVARGLAIWSSDGADRPVLIVRGQARLLEDVGATGELEKIRQLFDDIERKNDLIELLELAKQGDGVRIFIGSENPLLSLSGSSLIVAPYMNAERKVVGALGVIGPTRLNYARVIPVVDYTARVIGKVLDGRGSERSTS